MEINEVVNNVKVYGLEESIRRAKFPMSVDPSTLNTELTKGIKSLAQSNAGEGHDQWLTGVVVQFDLTFTVKAWTEMERYHFVDFVSSQSTMHRITKFDLNSAYISYVHPHILSIMKGLVDGYNAVEEYLKEKKDTLKQNEIDGIIERQKETYLTILYSNPCGMKLTAGITTNYRQLKTIYRQRKTHRLPEWRVFCRWIETLPNSELITGKE